MNVPNLIRDIEIKNKFNIKYDKENSQNKKKNIVVILIYYIVIINLIIFL